MARRPASDCPPYDEVIDSLGVRVPFVPAVITPKIERPLRNGRYEGGEAAALAQVLRPGDRVLELGAGLGLLSAIAARVPGIGAVTAVEANPHLIPLIRETHRLSGAEGVDLRNGVVAATPGPALPFHIRRDFWASSLSPAAGRFRETVALPRLVLSDLIAELRPTVLVCDIEGGEAGLFDGADLSGLRHVVIELHPAVYGAEGAERVAASLAAAGLHPDPAGRAGSSVRLFTRPARPVALPFAGRAVRPWPIRRPRFMVATCMKDEGPFILEWLAWHKAAGIGDFVVYTNDCSDGTTAILDRLQDLGHVLHLENPAVAIGSTTLQPAALDHAQRLAAASRADFFISIDVDEFINVHRRRGRLVSLLEATGEFDVLSMSELIHGSNRAERYMRGLVRDLFPLHQPLRGGSTRARRGVKSIVRLSERVEKLRNHRPDLRADAGPAVWLDGSGRPLVALAQDRSLNGIDARGSYRLVTLDHFPLRSLESFLVKMFRGDVVVSSKRVSQQYWRVRDRNDEHRSRFDRLDGTARAWAAAHLQGDARLMALHDDACAAHEARIAELLTRPEFIDRRAFIHRLWARGQTPAPATLP